MGCTTFTAKPSTPSKYDNFNKKWMKLWNQVLALNLDSPSVYFQKEVIRRFRTNQGKTLPISMVQLYILELKKFLFIRALHQSQIYTPSPLIDRLWKVLLECPTSYQQIVVKFGKAMYRDSRKFTLEGYNSGHQLLKMLFPKTHVSIWPKFATENQFLLAQDGFLHVPGPQLSDFLSQLAKTPPKSVKSELKALRGRILYRSLFRQGSALSLLGGITQGSGDEDIEDENEAPFTQSFIFDAALLNDMRNQKEKPIPLKLGEKKLEDDSSILPEDDAEFDDYGEKGYKKSVILGSIGPCSSIVLNPKLQLNWEDLKTGLELEIEQTQIPSRVIRAFAMEQSWTKDESQLVFDNYKKFLLLKFLVSENVKVAPSPLILRAWALHAAESRSYIKFCKKIFGSILSPSASSQEYSHYKTTLKLYEYVYATKRDETIWPNQRETQNCHVLYDVVGMLRTALEEKQDAVTESTNDRFEQELIKEAIAPMTNQI